MSDIFYTDSASFQTFEVTNIATINNIIVNGSDGGINTAANTLYTRYGIDAINWDTSALTDSSNFQSADWNNRYLYSTDGTTIAVNWQGNILNDTSAVGSVDWQNRQLLDAGGSSWAVNWLSYELGDTSGLSLNWSTRKTKDAANGNTSIDWENRILYAGNGANEVNQALVWSDTSTNNGVRLYGTSSYALTASYALNGDGTTINTSSFATTGSNRFNGNQIITGSLIVSSSGATIELYGDKIIVGAVGGDEGGEILLSKPSTNTTLTGSGITIDSYQNRLRFFEQGGNARGAYLDITTLSNGVGTNLQKSNNYFYDAYLINAQTTSAGVDTTINNISLVTQANEAWSFEFVTIGQCSGTGGVRFTVVYSATPISSSVTYWGNSTQVGNMSSATTILTTPAQSGTLWATATPIDVQAKITGCFVNSGNANTVTIKIQPVNGAQTATVRAMTYLTARRIS